MEIEVIRNEDLKAVISSIQANLHILKQLDPDNVYLMDFLVDIDNRILTTGIIHLTQLYINKEPLILNGTPINNELYKYDSDYTFINDLRKINTFIHSYIEQKSSSLYYAFRAIKEALFS